jgi:hypothetical protein
MGDISLRGHGVEIKRKSFAKGGKVLTDLTGDGKVTQADVLKGRGVFKKGGMTKSQKTISTAMRKFKKGKLHTGSKKGPVVKSRKQAIAIALSEAGKSKKK